MGFQDDGRVRRDPLNHDLTVGPGWRVWPDCSWRSSKDQRNRHPNRSWGHAAPDVVDDRSTRVQFDDRWYCFRPAVVGRDFSGPCQQIFWRAESWRSSVRWNRPDSGCSQCGYGVLGGRPHCWQESAGDPAVRLKRGPRRVVLHNLRNYNYGRSSPPFSRVFVAKSRRRRQSKARARRAPEAYLTVRRGARRSGTQHWRMDPAL